MSNPAPRRQIGVGSVLALVAGLLGLALLAVVLLLAVALVDRLGAAPRAFSDVGARAGALGSSAVRAAEDAAQTARDVLDPAHPPRGPLSYDAEFDELRRVDSGGSLAPHPERELTLAAVRKRVGAETPETAQYAAILDKLKTPRETRVLGVVVSRTSDERERFLYKGQVFRVGRSLYKVNWVSFDPPALAVARLRDPNTPVADLAFAID